MFLQSAEATAVATEQALVLTPRLVVTGERLNRRFLIRLDGREVWLSAGLFAAVCRLVHARCTTQTGFVSESPLVIFRLRLELAKAAGEGADSLISTGGCAEYRLSVERGGVSAEPSVAELPTPGLLTREEQQTLIALVVAQKLN